MDVQARGAELHLILNQGELAQLILQTSLEDGDAFDQVTMVLSLKPADIAALYLECKEVAGFDPDAKNPVPTDEP